MKKIMCCRKCDKRYPGCHDDCEAFQSEKGAMDTERNMIQEEKNRGYLNRGYIRDHMDGIRRRKR